MRNLRNTAAATVCFAACSLFNGCGDEFWMGPQTDGGDAQVETQQDTAEVAQEVDTAPEVAADPCKGVNCDDGNPCTTDKCDPAAGKCVNANNTAPCDDSDKCTSGDKCDIGKCVGEFVNCDDQNPCTTDVCDAKKGCQNVNNTVACDDSDKCTSGDKCSAGKCLSGAAVKCDDNNACTDDSCDTVKGCVNVNNTVACDDSDKCTSGDKCAAGKCTSGAGLKCDDNNACTEDSCDPVKGCVNAPAVAVPPLACDDNNACTEDDKCFGGKCVAGKSVDCDDANLCTDDACKGGKCVNTLNLNACDDNNACTVNDSCKAGKCASGAPVQCDDNNVCTSDSCDQATGKCNFKASNAATVIPCNDGDPSTENDVCNGATCKGVPPKQTGCKSDTDCQNDGNACNGVSICDKASGKCNTSASVACGEASSPCMVSACEPLTGKCVESQGGNNKPCNDGNVCTVSDACVSGSCKGTAIACDDQNLCTDDSCDSAKGCQHIASSAPCSDSNNCTTGDKCAAGKCESGQNTCECQADSDCASLEDGNSCNGTLICKSSKCVVSPKSVLYCDASKDTACAKNSCDPATGKCVFVPANAGLGCSDGDVCTSGDKCSGGVCMGEFVNCDDQNLCTDDSCDAKVGCKHVNNSNACDDGNAITETDKCGFGKCNGVLKAVECAKDNDCDDGKWCNGAEVCKLGKCELGAKPNCDDGVACTVDTCEESFGGNCKSVSKDSLCAGGEICSPYGCVECDWTNSDSICNDSNDCTTDKCKLGKCVHKALTAVGSWNDPFCSDSSKCTKADACDAGKCVGEVVNCDDNNPCTTDACDAKKGCVNAPNSAPCDDNNKCTSGDICANSKCASGAEINCDDGNACTYNGCSTYSGCYKLAFNCNDGNACTSDLCDSLKGCVNVTNADTCSDGNACTSSDSCAGGVCKAGTSVSCDDSNACTNDSCDQVKGCQHLNNVVACDDGNKCTSGDACKDGKCASGAAMQCNDNNACTADACDSATGKCVSTPIAGCPAPTPANLCIRWSNPSGGTFSFATINGCVGSFSATSKTVSCDGAVGNWKDQATASGASPMPTWCAFVPTGKVISANVNFSPCVASVSLGYCSFWSPAGDGKVPVTKLDIPGKFEYSVDGGSYVTIQNTTDSSAPAFLLDNGQGGANIVVKKP